MNPEEREWLAQEQAVACARNNRVDADQDALSTSYLAIARALRQPIEVQLPDDFAARLAAMATPQQPVIEIESSLEQRLLQVLGMVLGGAALVVGVISGASWFAPALGRLDQLGQPSLSLLLGLLACLGSSVLAQQLRRFAERRDTSLA